MNPVKKYSRKNIGKVIATNEGYDLEVIDGGSKKDYVTIKIEDWIAEVKTRSATIGSVKYPFHPSVSGAGHIGVGEYSVRNNKDAYIRWKHMIERCYDPKYHEKFPTYINCSVSIEWLNFQNFARWFYKNYPTDGLRYELDKDVSIIGNKIYSSSACAFIPAKINAFMAHKRRSNKSGHTGVSWQESCSKYIVSIYIDKKNKTLGRYTCLETASKVYQEARDIEAEKMRAYYSFDYPKSILDNIK